MSRATRVLVALVGGDFRAAAEAYNDARVAPIYAETAVTLADALIEELGRKGHG